MALILGKVRATLLGQIEGRSLERHLPASPQVVGEYLAEQIDQYARAQRLGYYPALDYFDALPGSIDPDLLDAARNIAWLAGNAIQEEITTRLRGVFSSVIIENLQCLAFTLPPVRISQRDAPARLARHYTPTQFRFSLRLSSLYKEQYADDIEQLTRRKVLRHLHNSFASLAITSAYVL